MMMLLIEIWVVVEAQISGRIPKFQGEENGFKLINFNKKC